MRYVLYGVAFAIASIVVVAGAIALGNWTLEGQPDPNNCASYTNISVEDVPAHCLTYFEHTR